MVLAQRRNMLPSLSPKTTTTKARSLPLLTPPQIQRLIASGHIIVIYEGFALQLDAWLDKHPGGRLVVEHMVGRDAGDEIDV